MKICLGNLVTVRVKKQHPCKGPTFPRLYNPTRYKKAALPLSHQRLHFREATNAHSHWPPTDGMDVPGPGLVNGSMVNGSMGAYLWYNLTNMYGWMTQEVRKWLVRINGLG